MTARPAAIEVVGLGVTFAGRGGGMRAVRDVSFTVADGESFGLVGESGSGKSTILRAIAGLVPEATGDVRVAGAPLGRRRTRADRRRLQFVFQDPYGALHPRHSVGRIIAEPLLIHGIGDVERRVGEGLAAVGLGEQHRSRFPHQLSGGQRQRVAIARALVLDPPILLLDEPTSALDVSIQAEILNLLARLRRERGFSYLLVSHDLAVVAHMCDRVGVMRKGELVEILPAEALRAGTAAHPYTAELVTAFRDMQTPRNAAASPPA